MSRPPETPAAGPQLPSSQNARLRRLTLGAIGVVFGDIGTSPVYTLKECIGAEHGVPPTPENVLGVLSLVVWSLIVVVTVKYLVVLMRADNEGQGGILALLAQVPAPVLRRHGGRVGPLALLVIAGAALLYGDGVITPAISVLSAVEGLSTYASGLRPATVPITCVILVGLFLIQRKGSGRVGAFFGPIMVIWYLTISALGLWRVLETPAVLAALSPLSAVRFLANHMASALQVLGSVVLAVTGAEALYADMGHFGRRPIRIAWYALVFPALLLCYLGQGAVTLAGADSENTFFNLVPRGPATLALVALATTTIASQALLSGAFSLTQQAIQLGYFPRVAVTHTTAETEGQVYVPMINWILAIGCLSLVLIFGHSSRLAAAFGLAVSGTMFVTSVASFWVARTRWRWSRLRAGAVTGLFLLFDVPFLIANLAKVPHGGFISLSIGAVFFATMYIWCRGRVLLDEALGSKGPDDIRALPSLIRSCAVRVPGVGVFLASVDHAVPPMLTHYVHRIGALHETIILLTTRFDRVPFARRPRPIEVTEVGPRLHRMVAHFGFLFRRARDLPRDEPRAHGPRHGDVVRLALAQRPVGDRLLRPAGRVGGRAGAAGRSLAGNDASTAKRKRRPSLEPGRVHAWGYGVGAGLSRASNRGRQNAFAFRYGSAGRSGCAGDASCR